MMKKNYKILSFISLLLSLFMFKTYTYASSDADVGSSGNAYDEITSDIIKSTDYLSGNRIAVLPFSYATSTDSVKDGSVIAERITMKLINTNVFQVIERNQLDKVMNELKIENSGIVDAETAKELGKVLGVDAIITGSLVKRTDGQIEINGRIIDTQTAKSVRAFSSVIKKDWLGGDSTTDSIRDRRFIRERAYEIIGGSK